LQSPDPRQVRRAFQVQEGLRELRQRDETKLLGVQACVWGDTHEGKPPPLGERRPADPVARKERIVDPSVSEIKGGVYPTLGQAIADARSGDVILIKHQGLLPVEPVRLERAGIELTIKPQPGYHPILTLGPTRELEAALFRLHDGQLRLEQLEFQLRPGQAGFRAQTLVTIVGTGQCTFKECAATLDGTDGVTLSVVTLADPNTAMRSEPRASRPTPDVRFQDCFVRGQGDLVAVRASRPFRLDVENALVVLTGSLLSVDGNSDDTPVPAAAQLTLNRLTTYLTDHLVVLRASRTGKGLVFTQATASDCLFAPAGGKGSCRCRGRRPRE
jgi:hypothetical protein